MRLFYAPEGRLRLETEDRCHLEVKPAWAAPISQPNRFLALLNGAEKEIVMFDSMEDAPPDMQTVLEGELKRRYLSSKIDAIEKIDSLFGTTEWKVRTGRGSRVFMTQSLHENSHWMSERHIVILDVDGNRYEITDVDALDKTSKRLFWGVI